MEKRIGTGNAFVPGEMKTIASGKGDSFVSHMRQGMQLRLQIVESHLLNKILDIVNDESWGWAGQVDTNLQIIAFNFDTLLRFWDDPVLEMQKVTLKINWTIRYLLGISIERKEIVDMLNHLEYFKNGEAWTEKSLERQINSYDLLNQKKDF